ncbi:hypothetical protein D0C36_04615 [Mucilaginibacter conchicola]|uniref:Glycosyl hydrolase family protein n=1 Tax=Mucilaginibacter conchicola TaxID=2303333 RepID=A0A372NXQ5_9SPHI|nr:family 1 glycosylhydrolase [Mucilaginibacter conchicola]RFZ94822.1 hypothetical protein D0C36_04615 [Mucilaginibacter conchicola]
MNLLPEKQVQVWGGVECTVNRVGDAYFDQLDQSGHWHRDSDIKMFASLGLKKMRFPIIWERHQPHKDVAIDWAGTAKKLNELRDYNIDVIAGLVHHGSGPAYVEIMEDSFAIGLAAYAAKVAEQFPWINYYTPINEPLTTARFCGLYGHWYPHATSDHTFCRILLNECKATVLAMEAIRKVNPDAKLVQTDDLAKVHSCPSLLYQSAFENDRRWLSFDLLCGHVNENHSLWEYLLAHGMAVKDLEYFIANPCPPDIMGVNYYLTSERYLDTQKTLYPVHTHGGNGRHTYADVEAVRVNNVRPAGINQLLREAWERYHIPIAITEVHLHCTREEQMRWLNEIWLAANRINSNGVSVIAITPWALLGSFGWDKLLKSHGGTYESGVFDLADGYPRPTILAAMIRSFSKGEMFFHVVLKEKGWWKRPCRIIYGSKQETEAENHFVQLIAVTGSQAKQLIVISKKRNLNIPVAINFDNKMKVITQAKPDLIIYFHDNQSVKQIDAALDILLDGVLGEWKVDEKGFASQCVKNVLPARCNIAV